MSSPASSSSSAPSSSPPDGAAPAVSVYRQAGFRQFLVARLLAVLATQIQAVVVAWQVYDLTREPIALAYVGLAQFLPMLALLLPAGDLIDRFSRKPILVAAWGVSAACASALWWLAAHSGAGAAGVAGIYAVLVVFGCARAFSAPALQSLLPQVVPREHLAQALAANSMLLRVASIGGPFLGGLLYAAGGGRLTYAVCAISLTLATLLLTQVPVARAVVLAAAGTIWQRFGAGIHFIRSRPIILGTISLDLFAVLLGGVVALLPVYAHEVLKVGPTGLGALRSAMALGEVVTGFYLAARPFDRHVGARMFWAVAVFGLANLVFAVSHWFWLSLVALAVAGAADMVSMYIRGALVQFSTPDDMRGRVNAVNMLFIGSSNELGEFRAGSAAHWLGAVPAAVTGALCTLGVVGVWSWRFTSIRRVDRFEEASPR